MPIVPDTLMTLLSSARLILLIARLALTTLFHLLNIPQLRPMTLCQATLFSLTLHPAVKPASYEEDTLVPDTQPVSP